MTLHIDDLPRAIREIKQKLRHELPDYKAVFEQLEGDMQRQIDAIRDEMPVVKTQCRKSTPTISSTIVSVSNKKP